MIKKKLLIILALGFLSLVVLPSAAAVSCNSGSLSTTCYIQSNQNVGGQTISGSGDLVVTSGDKLYTGMWNDVATIDMGGEVRVDGELEGNFRVYANKIDIQGTWDGNRKGWNDNSGPCEGDNCASASTPQQPGSGGNEGGYGKKRGGDGGGFIRLSGTVVNIDGAMYARGQDGRKVTYCCDPDGEGGAGGSVWVIAGRLTGNGYIDLDGGTSGDVADGEDGRIAYWYDESAESIDERTRQSFNTYGLDGSESFSRDITSEWDVNSVVNIPRFGDEIKVIGGDGNPVSGQAVYLKNNVSGQYNDVCRFRTGSDGTIDRAIGSNANERYLNSCKWEHWEGQQSDGYPNEGSSLFSGDTQDNWAISLSSGATDEFEWVGGMPYGETRTYKGSDKNIGFNNVTLNTDLSSGNRNRFLNFTVRNQTNDILKWDPVTVYKAGTDVVACRGRTNMNGFFGCGVDRNKVYDVHVDTSDYQNDIVYRNVRAPDVIDPGLNQNFIPESTLTNSIKFSAGHTLPAQTMISRPFSDFDVVNVSVEKTLNSTYRMVSNVLVRKYNVNFEGQWQDWSNRKTVTVQDIYNRDWSDSTGEMNDAWGIIEFNPEGFQNNDCSDVRLTDTSNNVQDFTVNTCDDDYVQLEFNAPINALEAKDFYVYYGNSGATDAQTPVERLSETEDFQMDNGITNTEGGFWFRSAGQKSFNMSIPQNVEFLNRDINIEGNNQNIQDNQLTSMSDDYQEFSGIEFTPKRPTVIEGLDLEMASTTVDSEIAVTNMSSGTVIHTHDIPDNGAGSYYLNFTDESLSEGNGDNIIYRSSDTFRIFVRNGQSRRQATTVTSNPMYDYPDLTVDNQVYSCSTDGTSCSTGDYPTLVSSIETKSLLPNLTITYENDGTVVYDDAQHLNSGTIDLSSILQSEEWREGDPLDNPRVHEFTVDSGDEGNITLESYTSFEFEHPVESVTKSAAACSVNPQSSTYFYIDKTDCPYLDRINVTKGQWFRLDYRFRVPGPADFENTGDINSYNVSDTMVRFNTLAETEEFTSG